jgi:hypothetical protein
MAKNFARPSTATKMGAHPPTKPMAKGVAKPRPAGGFHGGGPRGGGFHGGGHR